MVWPAPYALATPLFTANELCPTKAKDLNSPECETEKNDFKDFVVVQPIV